MNSDSQNLLFDILDLVSEIETLLQDREPRARELLRQINQRIVHNKPNNQNDTPSHYDLFK
jgi:hypothetical protein